MGNTSSTHQISAQDRAILDLKTQRDKLRRYQTRISVLTARETEIARTCLRQGDKRRALLALRRKKYQESLLEKTDSQLAQLEILASDVEFALVQKDVVFGLQQGTAVLKAIQREMGGLEKIGLIMGESEEAKGYQQADFFGGEKEVSEMLAGRISRQDEDEVEDELDALEREVSGVGVMPSVPDKEVGVGEGTAGRRVGRAQEEEEEEEERMPVAA
ncbi:SNF7 family protein [Piedraia hortae CBS 480.64]|uniref:SNF7 family protein n=1 Tax=Piedraia hortae CBS 480.64 TaxID=1314780 RepID=A0A6A7BXN0_9PEZI|nr:SNF7 family protein [Piedraia hortae CBS 480.64]